MKDAGERLLAELEQAPDDTSAREVYADVLEAAGEPVRAELARLANQMWRSPIDLLQFRTLSQRRIALRFQLKDDAWHHRMARPASAEIHRRLALLDELDAKRKVFGSKTHHYKLRPPLTPDALAAREAELGCTLPAQYRRFLLELGDGGPGPAHGILSLARATPAVAKPFEPMTAGAFPIADLGAGDFYWLVVTGERAGEVWWQVAADHGSMGLHLLDQFVQWLDTSMLHVAVTR